MHDVALRGATAVKAFAVYDRVSYIKVMPDASFARLGGTIVPKQYRSVRGGGLRQRPRWQARHRRRHSAGPRNRQLVT